MKKKIILAVSVILCIVGVVIFLPRDSSMPLPVDPLAAIWNGNQKNIAQQEGRTICIPGIDSLTFQAGTTSQSVNFQNPAVNGDRLFKFALLLEDESIWESGYCQAGFGYYDIEIEHPLTSGEYPAALQVRCFKPDGTELNGARIQFTIYVEE